MKYLLCIDGSAYADFALEVVTKLHKPGDEIIILSVGQFQEFSIPEKNRATPDENAEILADRYVAKFTELGIDNVTREVEEGDPRIVICYKAKDLNVDIIVMGSRGLGMIKKLLLGSVSEYVSAHGPCTTIIARAKDQLSECE